MAGKIESYEDKKYDRKQDIYSVLAQVFDDLKVELNRKAWLE